MHGQERPLFDLVHPAFPLPTTASPVLQGAQENGSGEAVVACDMPEPRKIPSSDSCQKRFLWTHKEFGLASRPIVGLVLQNRRCREVSSGTWRRPRRTKTKQIKTRQNKSARESEGKRRGVEDLEAGTQTYGGLGEEGKGARKRDRDRKTDRERDK